MPERGGWGCCSGGWRLGPRRWVSGRGWRYGRGGGPAVLLRCGGAQRAFKSWTCELDKTEVEDKTGQKRTEGRKEGRKEAAVVHTEGKDSRSGKIDGRREGGKKRRGQMKQKKPAQN